MAMQKKIVDFVHENHGLIGIQLAHAGRKASTKPPFVTGPNAVSDSDGGWTPVGASPIEWDSSYRKPHELSKAEIKRIIDDFVSATKRADQVGYDTIEIHGAHGYLITSFYSPLSNKVRCLLPALDYALVLTTTFAAHRRVRWSI
jgi:2,4-dienoyl-CoA reductase-like NADH-dependent reductase (Old Yellow Enzyme family)